MTAWLVLLTGPVAALALASTLARRRVAGARGAEADNGDEPARRELAGLREQLAEGELSPADYQELRERLATRIAASRPPSAPRRPRARRSAVWAVALAAVFLAAVLLVLPALRVRAPGAGPSGDDFVAAAEPPQPPASTAPAMTASRLAALLREAIALERAGKPAAAVRLYRTTLAFLPNAAAVRAELGFALARTGRIEEGIAQLRQTIAQAPRLPAARLYLGAVLWRQGNRAEARRQWRRYLALDPTGPGARLVRSELGAGAGRP